MIDKKIGRIFCAEGIVREQKFETAAEARAYSIGAIDALNAVDPDNDHGFEAEVAEREIEDVE